MNDQTNEQLDALILRAQDGDVLFVDADAIDVFTLRQVLTDKKIIIIPVQVSPGSSVSNAVSALRTQDSVAL